MSTIIRSWELENPFTRWEGIVDRPLRAWERRFDEEKKIKEKGNIHLKCGRKFCARLRTNSWYEYRRYSHSVWSPLTELAG